MKSSAVAKHGALALRVAVAALLAAGALAAWHWHDWFHPAAVTRAIAQQPAAPLVFIAAQVAASLFFVPRTLLAIASGLLFGMWWGIVWAAVGSAAGAVCGFLIARNLYGGMLDRANPGRLAALLDYAERGGWRMVAVLRLVPVIPNSLTNYALGLTRVGLGAYAFGSLIGQLPLTVAFVDLGAAGGGVLAGGGDWRHQVLWPSAIGLTALLLSLVLPALVRRRRQAAPAPGA